MLVKYSRTCAFAIVFLVMALAMPVQTEASSHTGAINGEIKDPGKVSQLNVRIMQSGAIDVNQGNVNSISINLTAPQNTDTQRVETLGNHIPSRYGDTILNIYQDDPEIPYSYSVQSLATV